LHTEAKKVAAQEKGSEQMRWHTAAALAVMLASTLGGCGNDFDYEYGQGVTLAQQQGYDPDDEVECGYGGQYFGSIENLPAAVCMQHSKGQIFGPSDTFAYQQKQKQKKLNDSRSSKSLRRRRHSQKPWRLPRGHRR
jgi:hypothetical protein